MAERPDSLKGKKATAALNLPDERSYVVDSGASSHMIGVTLLTKKELATKKKLKEPFHIQTADGIVHVTHEVRIRVQGLNINFRAGLLDDAPCCPFFRLTPHLAYT